MFCELTFSCVASSLVRGRMAKVKWLITGHEFLGANARRLFDGEGTNGRIVKWSRATEEDPPLWHMVHADGDEEDLEEAEVLEAITCYNEHCGVRAPRAAAKQSASNWKKNI